MSLMTILGTLLLGPLKLAFEFIFVIAERLVHSPGLAIVVLSLAINIMMLPLHRRADAVQEQARDVEAKLKPGVDHIKKTFSGDERMMILQTYYRQNNYRPTDALNGSVSLLLEVPFFMAAYQFLSRLEILQNVSFGPIADLGAPDGMLVMGAVTINLLPILMTLLNILSGMVYSKGFPLKTKLQMYGLALVFLVVLYGSPSGLVFYWTLNNLFSLGKNLYNHVKPLQKLAKWLFFFAGIAAVIFGIFVYRFSSIRRNILIVGIGICFMLPLLLQLLQGKIKLPAPKQAAIPNHKLFILGSLFLTIQTGVLIPSVYIAASPLEFVDPRYYHDPMLYILMATCLAAGTFLIWLRVFHWLSSDSGKVLISRIVWILCGVFLVNYMFFGKNLGMLYSNLQYAERILHFSAMEELLNPLVMVALVAVMGVAVFKWERSAQTVLLAGVIALGSMSAMNIVSIKKDVGGIEAQVQLAKETTPSFHLSKEGNNVVVIMLDRALGQLVPYLFNEKQELQQQFDGFTYYENTISFGRFTVFGSPAMMGGYEYTPVEMNKRSEESLVDKHNEALKVIPVLFSQNGYETTVMDPVYANHQWIPDLSIYDAYPEIDTYLTNGVYVDDIQRQVEIDSNYRNFFCFSIMKSAPVALQRSIYSLGSYNKARSADDLHSAQIDKGMSRAEGYYPKFMDEYSILSNMDTMTEITDENVNTYMFIDNNLTHEPMLLQEPEYIPVAEVDNTAYDKANQDRFTLNGRTLNIKTFDQMSHYHTNMAAMIQLGKWFDYLRENDVYDNTRIIIVSDHGRNLNMLDELQYEMADGTLFDLSTFDALLMVKDFGSTGFTTSSEFMTNADVPALSVAGLIENPVNPFTGKVIDNSEKYAHPQIVLRSAEFGIVRNQGNTFNADLWASISDNFWDLENWTFSDTKTVLSEHMLP